MSLKTAAGSEKSAQALGAPRKTEKCLLTTVVTTILEMVPLYSDPKIE